jgi:hypothetical protein
MQENQQNCPLADLLNAMSKYFDLLPEVGTILEWYNTADLFSGGCFHGCNIS